jgi:hypothetical protein
MHLLQLTHNFQFTIIVVGRRPPGTLAGREARREKMEQPLQRIALNHLAVAWAKCSNLARFSINLQ